MIMYRNKVYFIISQKKKKKLGIYHENGIYNVYVIVKFRFFINWVIHIVLFISMLFLPYWTW